MLKLLTAIALTIALPGVAYAAELTPPPKQDCCEKMKQDGKECCCKEHAKDHAEHGGHQR